MESRFIKKFLRLDLVRRSTSKLGFDFSQELIQDRELINYNREFFANSENFHAALVALDNLEKAKSEYDNSISQICNDVEDIFRRREIRILQTDYYNYENRILPFEEYLNSNNSLSLKAKEFIVSEIQNRSSWQFAAVDLNPVDGEFTRMMTANDPLYVIYRDENHKEIVRKKFNEFYGTRRLRAYTDINELPDNQLGLAYCFNMFELMPLDPIKEFCKTLFQKMRPGGAFVFSYTDCNQRATIEMLPYEGRSYNTKETMKGALYSLGWDIVKADSIEQTFSYMLVKKPGELSSIKLNTPGVVIAQKLNDEQILWIEKYRMSTLKEWIDKIRENAHNFPDSNLDLQGGGNQVSHKVREYIQKNIDSQSN